MKTTAPYFFIVRNAFVGVFRVCVCLLLLTGCSRFKSHDEYSSHDTSPASNSYTNKSYNRAPQQAQIGGGINDAVKQAQRNKQQTAKLIRNANLVVRAENARAMLDSVKLTIIRLQGTITYESENVDGNELIIKLVASLPSEQLEMAVTQIASYATMIMSKSIAIEDVGEQIVDLEARLTTKREVEHRYRDLLKQAKTVQDVLAVEQQLNALREEMESQQGRLAYLNNRVAESTLNVSIQAETPSSLFHKTFGQRFSIAFSESWENLQSMTLLLISLFPVLVAVFGIFVLIVWGWRKYRTRNSLPKVQQSSHAE